MPYIDSIGDSPGGPAMRPSVPYVSRRGRAAGLVLALGLALGVAGPAPAGAQDLPVDLELVLAVDVSRSMRPEEQRLQRDGYVAAFRDPALVQAVGAGLFGRIAVAYVEWAGVRWQSAEVPWMLIDGPDAAAAFADAIAAVPMRARSRTSISGAILTGLALFEDNGFEGTQRKIDVSGDGPNNQGMSAPAARDRAVAAGVTVNGLTIMIDRDMPDLLYSIEELDIYYEDCVIGGPGAFNLVIAEPADFARAIRAKLLLEIAGIPPEPPLDARPPGVRLAQVTPPRVDCMIGERLWEERRGMIP
jgi:hypothetical protein